MGRGGPRSPVGIVPAGPSLSAQSCRMTGSTQSAGSPEPRLRLALFPGHWQGRVVVARRAGTPIGVPGGAGSWVVVGPRQGCGCPG